MKAAPYSVAGITLSAVEAIQGGQETFTKEQVAYLFGLAYEIGRRHTLAEDLAETIANWDEHTLDDGRCTVVRPALRGAVRNVREKRKAARLAEYERLAGPPRFEGGLPPPPSTYPSEGRRTPRFPTLTEQAEWLTTDDIAYLRRRARAENETQWQRRPTRIGVAA